MTSLDQESSAPRGGRDLSPARRRRTRGRRGLLRPAHHHDHPLPGRQRLDHPRPPVRDGAGEDPAGQPHHHHPEHRRRRLGARHQPVPQGREARRPDDRRDRDRHVLPVHPEGQGGRLSAAGIQAVPDLALRPARLCAHRSRAWARIRSRTSSKLIAKPPVYGGSGPDLVGPAGAAELRPARHQAEGRLWPQQRGIARRLRAWRVRPEIRQRRLLGRGSEAAGG